MNYSNLGCFLGSEYVRMADGTEKRLEEIKPGEWVSCHFNEKVEVLGIRRALVFGNKMYKINKDLITSGEHRFWSEKDYTWIMCDEKYISTRKTEPWRMVSQGSMNSQAFWYHIQEDENITPRKMNIGDKVVVNKTDVEITSIEPIQLPLCTEIMTLITTSSFILRGGWVVGGWAGEGFNKPIDKDYRMKKLIGELV